QGDDLTLLDAKRHSLHGDDGAVSDDEVLDGEEGSVAQYGFETYLGLISSRKVAVFPFILMSVIGLTGTQVFLSIVRAPVRSGKFLNFMTSARILSGSVECAREAAVTSA